MDKDIKLVHVKIVDGTQEEIIGLSKAFKENKARLPRNLEFLVTNDAIELRDVKYLIDELYKLYKMMKKDEEEKKEEKKSE